jgi:Fucose 4-O-acetylase and related acetyltransferases
MNKNTESRIDWVDIFKGIMILLVVIGHATGKFNPWIYQFHMAAFFLASGYLSTIEKKNDISRILKKFMTLILPYLSLGLLGILVNAVLDYFGYYNFLFGTDFLGIGKSVSEMFLNGNLYVQYWGTFWFLTTLFAVEVLQFIVFHINNKKINLIYFSISLLLFFTGYIFVESGINSHLLDLVFIAQFYYTIGLFVRKLKPGHSMINSNYIGYAICALVATVISVWGYFNKITVDWPSRSFRFPVAESVVAFASIYLVFFVSITMDRIRKGRIFHKLKRMITSLGENSLGIMVFHFAFFKIYFVVLYLCGLMNKEEVGNIVFTTELAAKYWLGLTIFSVIASLLLWKIMTKTPIINLCLGQNSAWNKKISEAISANCIVRKISGWISNLVQKIWTGIYCFHGKNKYYLPVGLLGIALIFIPYYRTGIIINDELQARFAAFSGFWSFFKSEFRGWISQGRILAAPVNSITKFCGFIGAANGTYFRIPQIIILLGISIAFGVFLHKLFKNSKFAVFTSVLGLACMPILFEHMSPNAFVSLFGIPFILLLISFVLYIDYIENKKTRKLIFAMMLFFITQMSYEIFITFLVLYFFIAAGKTGIKNIKHNKCLYIIPFATAVLYLVCYVLSGMLFPSQYGGNQIGFESIMGPLIIIKNLFLVCIPGIYVFMPKYTYYKELYHNNLETGDYIRILAVAVVFCIICIWLLKNPDSIDRSERDAGKKKRKHLYIIFAGVCYMILPSLPLSISSMYQGNVGEHGFTALPVTFFEYFAAIFVLAYLIWQVGRYIGKRYYIIFTGLLCLLVVNVQQMNDMFSREQNRNFNRLVTIESFLQTEVVRNLENGTYEAKDLYAQQNLLAIHSGYWTAYCNNILGLPLQLSDNVTEMNAGNIYYDGDNFTIVKNESVIIVSQDNEIDTKAVKVGEDQYQLYDFSNKEASIDNEFYIYQSYITK